MLERIGIKCTEEEERAILGMCANTFPYFEVAENLKGYLNGTESISIKTLSALKQQKEAIERTIRIQFRGEDF